MNTQFHQVRHFLETFVEPTPENVSVPETAVSFARAERIREEAIELTKALTVEAYTDAICDLLYVVLGAAVASGISASSLKACFDEVHRSNMTKGWTEDEVDAASAGVFKKHLGGYSGTFSQNFKVENLNTTNDRCFVVRRRSDNKVMKSPSYSQANFTGLIKSK
jgi:phosphoribosyl-ATP pyrophosphohydrolase